jgi:RNA-directed DNA polymerase
MGLTSLENGMGNIINDAASPGRPSNWHSIDWKLVNQFVGKMQMRLAKAEMEKDFRRVAKLRRSLIRSWQAKVLAVRKITGNQGKRSSGVDCELWDTPQKKWGAICRMHRKGYRAPEFIS